MWKWHPYIPVLKACVLIWWWTSQPWAGIISLPLNFADDVVSGEATIHHKIEEIAIDKKVVNITSYEDDRSLAAIDPFPSVWWSPLDIKTTPMNSEDKEFYLNQDMHLDIQMNLGCGVHQENAFLPVIL